MQWLDWLVIGVYFFGLALVVWWSSTRQKTSEDYFLAGRNVGWFVVGASLFASNIGSEHIVGLAGQGTNSGVGMAHWELHAWVMIMLAWVFVPFYIRSGVFTMPEFLEKRFSPTARWILSIVSIVAYVFTKVSVTVYAGALVFQTLLPDVSINFLGRVWGPFWIGAFSTVIVTGIYTVFGGLRAVVYTDTAQTFVLLLGSFFITFFGLSKLGGWSEMVSICKTNAEQFALWRPNSNPDFPWLGIIIASPVIGIWYWCTDQYIVQRALAAKNLRNARRGAIWGGFLKVWPVLIFLVPGMIGYALHQKGIISIPVENGTIKGDMVFPTMVTSLLPMGLRGLVVAGLLAALMSSLSSLFNSSASLFTVDIYEKIWPGRSERHLVTVGRIATTVIVGLGILWIPVMHRIGTGGLYQYLQSVQSYLAPPITAVFLLGLFWKRINSKGAVAGLAIGFVLGMAKLTIQAFYGAAPEKINAPEILAQIGDYNFLFASGWLLAISVFIIVVVSLLSKKPSEEKIAGLTYATVSAENKRENRESWNKWDVIASCVVLGMVLTMYLYFSFWLS